MIYDTRFYRLLSLSWKVKALQKKLSLSYSPVGIQWHTSGYQQQLPVAPSRCKMCTNIIQTLKILIVGEQLMERIFFKSLRYM